MSDPTQSRFAGRTVLVTGAASGIGKAAAERMAAEGGQLACADINAAGLEATVAGIREAGGEAEAFALDLGDPASVKACVAAAVERFGKLDALCNVAGILHSAHTHEYALEDWDRVLRINLTGPFLMCQAAIPHLLETKGYIVNTSSTAALGSHPWMSAYAASKGGIRSLTKVLAIEYVTQGLNVNCVIPGAIMTPLHSQFSMPKGADGKLVMRAMPLVKYAKPDAAAGAIAMLASADARFMNGAEVRIDGGAMS